MEQVPIIRLEIESMKHAILHHFNLYQETVSNAVANELEKVVAAYDYEKAIAKAASEVLDDTIKEFFKYGEGKYVIRDAIKMGLENAFKKGDS